MANSVTSFARTWPGPKAKDLPKWELALHVKTFFQHLLKETWGFDVSGYKTDVDYIRGKNRVTRFFLTFWHPTQVGTCIAVDNIVVLPVQGDIQSYDNPEFRDL